jgi:hypothetical protein
MTYKRNRPTERRHLKTPLLVVFTILALLAVVVTALELTDTTHLFHTRKPSYNSPTASPATKGIPEDEAGSASQANTDSANPSTQNDDAKHPTSETPSSAPLIAPNGNFVNRHDPSGNEQMESICNTTPGATCQITFIKGSATKSLPAQTADRGGATYWAWKIKDTGLTPGIWKITVTATQGSEKKAVTDTTDLEVAP